MCRAMKTLSQLANATVMCYANICITTLLPLTRKHVQAMSGIEVVDKDFVSKRPAIKNI